MNIIIHTIYVSYDFTSYDVIQKIFFAGIINILPLHILFTKQNDIFKIFRFILSYFYTKEL